MTEREKLVGIMGELPIVFCDCCGEDYLQNKMLLLADHLIANGVTVQNWISVKDELPKSEVLAANFAPGTHGYKECIIGFVSGERCTESGGVRCGKRL